MGIVHAQGRGFMMGLVVYFGFFTVLTNLLAALVITGHAAGPRTPTCKSAASPVVMTTITAAITMPGAVYFLILRHTWKPEGAQFWVDAALHCAVPTLVVVFWAWTMPARSVLWKNAPWLFAYPLVYLVYVFARGELVRLYPYPFIDVLPIGYPAAVLNSAGMMVAYALIVGVFCGLKMVLPVSTSRK